MAGFFDDGVDVCVSNASLNFRMQHQMLDLFFQKYLSHLQRFSEDVQTEHTTYLPMRRGLFR